MLDTSLILSSIALIAQVLFGLFPANRWLSRKRLSYKLSKFSDVVIGRTFVSEEGEPLQVRVLPIRIINSGSIPVTASDFESPITISFAEGTVNGVQIKDSFPANFKPKFKVAGSSVEIVPCLFNSGDYVTFDILLNSYAPLEDLGLRVDARITGIRKIGKVRVEPLTIYSVVLIFVLEASLFSLIIFYVDGQPITLFQVCQIILFSIFGTAAFFVLGSRAVDVETFE